MTLDLKGCGDVLEDVGRGHSQVGGFEGETSLAFEEQENHC